MSFAEILFAILIVGSIHEGCLVNEGPRDYRDGTKHGQQASPKMLVTEWPHVAGEALVDLVREISPDDADRIEQALEAAFAL